MIWSLIKTFQAVFNLIKNPPFHDSQQQRKLLCTLEFSKSSKMGPLVGKASHQNVSPLWVMNSISRTWGVLIMGLYTFPSLMVLFPFSFFLFFFKKNIFSVVQIQMTFKGVLGPIPNGLKFKGVELSWLS